MYSPYQTPRFWKEYQAPLKSYVRKRVTDPDVAKDILQDIFFKVYTYCQRHDFSCEKAGISNLRAWMFQTAQNAIVEHYRKQKPTAEINDDLLPDLSESSNQYRDMSEFVKPLLQCLPVMYRVPLAMELEGIPQKQIASQLNLGLSAVKSRIQRARQQFKELTHECFYLDLDQKGHIEAFAAKPDCQILKCIQNQTSGCSVHLT
jgi:RNA polymerase sigma-70 factor (ECF subfamily)